MTWGLGGPARSAQLFPLPKSVTLKTETKPQ